MRIDKLIIWILLFLVCLGFVLYLPSPFSAGLGWVVGVITTCVWLEFLKGEMT